LRSNGAHNGGSYNPDSVPDEITCLIVDDHEVVREGLRLSLSRAPHIRVVGEASDGAGAVALAERRRPDVVIMDVRMPGMDGLEATKQIGERVPGTAVIIFTAYSERTLLSRGLDSGCRTPTSPASSSSARRR
jgi:DNA-binding NarL/FixJ family response regulator